MFKTHHHYIINTQHIFTQIFCFDISCFCLWVPFPSFASPPKKKSLINSFLPQVYPQIFTQPSSERMSGRSTPTIPNLRVLVVDDDVLCLKIVTKMLQKCGYTGTFLVRIVLVFYVLRRSIFRKALIYKLRKKTATPVGELFETLTEKTRPLVRGGFKKVMKN